MGAGRLGGRALRRRPDPRARAARGARGRRRAHCSSPRSCGSGPSVPRLLGPARAEGAAPGRRAGPGRRRRAGDRATPPRSRSTTRSTAAAARRASCSRRCTPARRPAPRTASPPIGAAASRSGRCASTVTDPFGLVQRTRFVLGTEEVIVYPRVRDVLAAARDGRPRPRPRAAAGAVAHRAERRVPHACASTRRATTSATCTGGRPRGAGT